MSETISAEEFRRFVELAPNEILLKATQVVCLHAEDLPDDSPEFESATIICSCIGRELVFREIEPLWRKAKRFALRNSGVIKNVGKIAACIGVGALLGISLDD